MLISYCSPIRLTQNNKNISSSTNSTIDSTFTNEFYYNAVYPYILACPITLEIVSISNASYPESKKWGFDIYDKAEYLYSKTSQQKYYQTKQEIRRLQKQISNLISHHTLKTKEAYKLTMNNDIYIDTHIDKKEEGEMKDDDKDEHGDGDGDEDMENILDSTQPENQLPQQKENAVKRSTYITKKTPLQQEIDDLSHQITTLQHKLSNLEGTTEEIEQSIISISLTDGYQSFLLQENNGPDFEFRRNLQYCLPGTKVTIYGSTIAPYSHHTLEIRSGNASLYNKYHTSTNTTNKMDLPNSAETTLMSSTTISPLGSLSEQTLPIVLHLGNPLHTCIVFDYQDFNIPSSSVGLKYPTFSSLLCYAGEVSSKKQAFFAEKDARTLREQRAKQALASITTLPSINASGSMHPSGTSSKPPTSNKTSIPMNNKTLSIVSALQNTPDKDVMRYHVDAVSTLGLDKSDVKEWHKVEKEIEITSLLDDAPPPFVDFGISTDFITTRAPKNDRLVTIESGDKSKNIIQSTNDHQQQQQQQQITTDMSVDMPLRSDSTHVLNLLDRHDKQEVVPSSTDTDIAIDTAGTNTDVTTTTTSTDHKHRNLHAKREIIYTNFQTLLANSCGFEGSYIATVLDVQLYPPSDIDSSVDFKTNSNSKKLTSSQTLRQSKGYSTNKSYELPSSSHVRLVLTISEPPIGDIGGSYNEDSLTSTPSTIHSRQSQPTSRSLRALQDSFSSNTSHVNVHQATNIALGTVQSAATTGVTVAGIGALRTTVVASVGLFEKFFGSISAVSALFKNNRNDDKKTTKGFSHVTQEEVYDILVTLRSKLIGNQIQCQVYIGKDGLGMGEGNSIERHREKREKGKKDNMKYYLLRYIGDENDVDNNIDVDIDVDEIDVEEYNTTDKAAQQRQESHQISTKLRNGKTRLKNEKEEIDSKHGYRSKSTLDSTIVSGDISDNTNGKTNKSSTDIDHDTGSKSTKMKNDLHLDMDDLSALFESTKLPNDQSKKSKKDKKDKIRRIKNK